MTHFANALSELAKRAALERQQRLAKETRDRLIDIHSSAFNHASTYSVIVIFGGYAALFTIWTYTKGSTSSEINVWVGLLIGVSVLAFVLFEVFQMIAITMANLKIRAVLTENLTPEIFLERLDELKHRSDFFTMRVLMPAWGFTLFVTLATGLAAAGLLFYSFATTLI